MSFKPCILTWYDPALGGTNSASGQPDPNSPTASGEPYDPNALTCAAPPAYPFGTMITFRYGGRQVTCRVNDRGGAIQGNHFDLSRGAADQLGIIGAGRVNAEFDDSTLTGAGSSPPPTDTTSSATSSTASKSSGGGWGSGALSIMLYIVLVAGGLWLIATGARQITGAT